MRLAAECLICFPEGVEEVRIDFQLNFTREAITLVDRHLAELDRTSMSSVDADAEGIWDRANYLAGVGFVVLQSYQSAAMARSDHPREHALSLEPMHTCGRPMAALVDAAANHWKHRSEWSRANPTSRAQSTLDAFDAMEVNPWGEYALANALYALVAPHPHRFSSILPFVERWRENLIG